MCSGAIYPQASGFPQTNHPLCWQFDKQIVMFYSPVDPYRWIRQINISAHKAPCPYVGHTRLTPDGVMWPVLLQESCGNNSNNLCCFNTVYQQQELPLYLVPVSAASDSLTQSHFWMLCRVVWGWLDPLSACKHAWVLGIGCVSVYQGNLMICHLWREAKKMVKWKNCKLSTTYLNYILSERFLISIHTFLSTTL